MKRDYYEILGISKNSTTDEIKKSYRKVAMKFHPDRNPDNKEAEEKFKEAAEAYSVLSNNDKRSRYDQFGHDGVNQRFDSGFSGGINVEDIFNSVFGGSGGFGDIFGQSGFGSTNQRNTNNNLKISIPLTLEEIYEGTSKTIKIKRWERSTNDKPTQCNKCNGSGEVKYVQRSMLGQIINVQMCSSCDGVGYIGGREQNTKTLKIKIPAGVSDGNYMTLSGEGNQSITDSDNGDLMISFKEKIHELFYRDENDIYIECQINYHDAVLGTEIEVPTLSGKVKLKIPSGIKNGQILRLKNKGIKEVNRYKSGDQYIKISVNIPQKISNKEKEILISLKENFSNKIVFKKINNSL